MYAVRDLLDSPVPSRYILLMETQMKRLDESSPECEHINAIRTELKHIASRCEDELVVSPSQIRKLKARFDGKDDYFKTQRLIWHGALKWRSPRRRVGIGQYYLLLFSKCLLICEESGEKLVLNKFLSIGNATIDTLPPERPAANAWNALDKEYCTAVIFPFRVNALEDSCEFLIEKESERQRWISKIKQAADDSKRRTVDVEGNCLVSLGLSSFASMLPPFVRLKARSPTHRTLPSCSSAATASAPLPTRFWHARSCLGK